MQRKTITINDELFRAIQKIRASFIQSEDIPLDDMSFTTALNMILLGGIVGIDDFSEKTWGTIRSFVEDQEEALEKASLRDREYEKTLRKLYAEERKR